FDEPGYARLHNNLGWLYQYYMENDQQAALHLKYAIKFDPKLEAAYYNLADLYKKHDKYKELVVFMQKALNKTGACERVIYEILGEVHEAQCEFSMALKYYKRALYKTTDSYDAGEIRRGIKRCKYKRLKRIF
ncbi:MAG: hypothetical protein R3345_15160, partial [Fulvivirga sp.]|nr:hypothetical protein [Fulvivirga sp.]